MPPPPQAPRGASPVFDRERPRSRRRRPAPDWGGDELFDQVPRRRFAREPADVTAPDSPPAAAVRHPVVHPDDGAPAAPGRALAPSRARRVEQRITASPDRVAAWAFALGLLLILVAIATSL